jgi:transcriptional regulator GlxA family with amidase domain
MQAFYVAVATTTLEAAQIADRVGFSDVRSLRRFFKAHSGKTVNEFRAETLRSWLGDQTLG